MPTRPAARPRARFSNRPTPISPVPIRRALFSCGAPAKPLLAELDTASPPSRTRLAMFSLMKSTPPRRRGRMQPLCSPQCAAHLLRARAARGRLAPRRAPLWSCGAPRLPALGCPGGLRLGFAPWPCPRRVRAHTPRAPTPRDRRPLGRTPPPHLAISPYLGPACAIFEGSAAAGGAGRLPLRAFARRTLAVLARRVPPARAYIWCALFCSRPVRTRRAATRKRKRKLKLKLQFTSSLHPPDALHGRLAPPRPRLCRPRPRFSPPAPCLLPLASCGRPPSLHPVSRVAATRVGATASRRPHPPHANSPLARARLPRNAVDP